MKMWFKPFVNIFGKIRPISTVGMVEFSAKLGKGKKHNYTCFDTFYISSISYISPI
jgi:hypothetical protein